MIKNIKTLGTIALASAIVSCADTASATPTERSFPYLPAQWSVLDIDVCYENPSLASAADKASIRQGFATWEAASLVRFKSFGQCIAASKGIRIKLADEVSSSRIGSYSDGVAGGMTLNTIYKNNLTFCNVSEAARQYCNRTIAAHEVGHAAFGLLHEQNRPDTPKWCQDQEGSDGITGGATFTTYDPQSIMNYCADSYNNGGLLTDKDKLTADVLAGNVAFYSQGVLYIYNVKFNGASYDVQLQDLGGLTFGLKSVANNTTIQTFDSYTFNGNDAVLPVVSVVSNGTIDSVYKVTLHLNPNGVFTIKSASQLGQ